MHKLYTLLFVFIFLAACVNSQNIVLGGPCEGCEAIHDFGNKTLKSIDTLPEFSSGANKIVINGIIYKSDGTTPAKDVILYVYHTNSLGKYPTKSTSSGWEKRHGYLRAWLKTDMNGHYKFYTTIPASYPNSTIP